MTGPDHDVLIVGAGISGISMAAHLKGMRPQSSFAMIERRERLGGTWDLFRYPGIRSDSDMHTLGFAFEPWTDERTIAGGEAIRQYLERVVGKYGFADRISYSTRVVSADWRPDEADWRIILEDGDGRREVTARWLHLASGYYDYDQPHQAHLPGLENFGGRVVHPQFWPESLDYSGKRVVVVGSGATAVTLVPAMARDAAHVAMLQRTPTWMVAQPSRDKWARRLRRWLGEERGSRLVRWINVRLHRAFFLRSRRQPQKVAAFLRAHLKKKLGRAYDPVHFEPPYDPWDQRLCLVPDGDLFDALKRGAASIATGCIAGFTPDAVLLENGESLPADILVMATGLKLEIGGKITVSLEGVPVDWTRHWFYRGCMFSNLPNLSVVFGYLNASWTLRADNTSAFVCRVLEHMEKTGSNLAVPDLPVDHAMVEADVVTFSSGYLQRAKPLMPKSSPTLPWRLNMDYLEDCRDFRQRPVADGVLRFQTVAFGRELA